MKPFFKGLLKKWGLYYFLQGHYRVFLSWAERLKNKKRYSKFRGPGFTCNICGASYSRFIPHYPERQNRGAIADHHVIAGYGENIYCPACGSSARQRLVIAALHTHIEVRHKNILHLSPEKLVFDFIKDQANVLTADIEPGFYRIIDPGILFADATRLPFQDDRFDVIIANHVLEHIPDDQAAIREFYRVLKQGGRAVLQVPYSLTIASTIEQPDIGDPAMQAKLFGQNDHVRIYGFQDYMSRLRKAGFRVEAIPSRELMPGQACAFQEEEQFISITK